MVISVALSSVADAAKLNLLQVVELGRQYDDALKIAEKGVEEGRLQQRSSRASLLPQLSATASVTHNANTDLGGVGGGEYRDTRESLSLTQTLWNPQQNALYAASKKRLEVARIEQAKAAAANLLNVTEAYLDLLSATSGLQLATRNVAGVEAHKKTVDALFEIRESTILDRAETLADLDLAALSLLAADNTLSDRYENLVQLIGIGEYELTPVNVDLSVIDEATDPPLHEWLGGAEKGNYDLRIAWLQLEIAAINRKQARQDFQPRVSLRGSFNRNRNHGGLLASNQGDITRQAVVSVDLPLYQGGRLRAKLLETQVAYDRQQLRIAQQIKRLRQQITVLYNNRQSARARVSALRSLVSSNRRKFAATRDGFTQGDRTSNEVLTAQNLLIESENDLVSAVHDYILSRLQLRNAIGALSLEDIKRTNQLYFASN